MTADEQSLIHNTYFRQVCYYLIINIDHRLMTMQNDIFLRKNMIRNVNNSLVRV